MAKTQKATSWGGGETQVPSHALSMRLRYPALAKITVLLWCRRDHAWDRARLFPVPTPQGAMGPSVAEPRGSK